LAPICHHVNNKPSLWLYTRLWFAPLRTSTPGASDQAEEDLV
ncbi:hypothetical protein A2U01_0117092, partial [Trifolium medium]|nr:hypothetical protein [Trifolium medium]